MFLKRKATSEICLNVEKYAVYFTFYKLHKKYLDILIIYHQFDWLRPFLQLFLIVSIRFATITKEFRH